MYVHTYVCIYILPYIHAWYVIHTYIRIHTHTYAYIRIHTYILAEYTLNVVHIGRIQCRRGDLRPGGRRS